MKKKILYKTFFKKNTLSDSIIYFLNIISHLRLENLEPQIGQTPFIEKKKITKPEPEREMKMEKVELPTLPRGRYLEFVIHSTHGDKYTHKIIYFNIFIIVLRRSQWD